MITPSINTVALVRVNLKGTLLFLLSVATLSNISLTLSPFFVHQGFVQAGFEKKLSAVEEQTQLNKVKNSSITFL
jgi:hypothetical protein